MKIRRITLYQVNRARSTRRHSLRIFLPINHLFLIILFFFSISSCTANNTECISYDGNCDLITTWLLFQYDRSIVPNAIDGLQLWLKADVFSNRADASDVSGWPDLSGFGRDALQGTVANQPKFYNSQLNNLPVVRFDGNDYMDILSLNLNPSTTSFTILILFQLSPTGVDDLISQRDGTGTGRSIFQYNSGGCSNNMASFLNGTSSCVNSEYTANTWSLYGMTWDNTDFLINFYRLGILDGTASLGGVQLADGNWRMGASKAAIPGNYLLGDIAEIIIYDSSLDNAVREGVECHLSKKYGIVVSQFCG